METSKEKLFRNSFIISLVLFMATAITLVFVIIDGNEKETDGRTHEQTPEVLYDCWVRESDLEYHYAEPKTKVGYFEIREGTLYYLGKYESDMVPNATEIEIMKNVKAIYSEEKIIDYAHSFKPIIVTNDGEVYDYTSQPGSLEGYEPKIEEFVKREDVIFTEGDKIDVSVTATADAKGVTFEYKYGIVHSTND